MEDLTKEFLEESREGLDRMEVCLTELERRYDRELVAEIFRAVHTMKGSAGVLGYPRLLALAHTGEGLLAALRDERIVVSSGLISGLLELRDTLRRILDGIEARGSEGDRQEDTDQKLIEWMATLEAGQLPQAKIIDKPAKESAPARGSAREEVDRTLRVEVDVLNQMMNLVGDLVLTRNQMLQSQPGEAGFAELQRRLNSVTTSLRESVMQARLQPVNHVFSKFPRMVRDLAQQCGRRVRLEFEGQETTLDKSLLEAVRDPLVHAVRNAVDHGIEPEAERLRAGKPAEGVVRLRASQQNGMVVIEVSDDGAGISAARVLAKAVERGIVTAEQAATMSESEALRLIFASGLSTAEKLTNVSGRGVGMDVVRTHVEHAGGRVEIESQVGRGTILRLRVPLTLAIVPAVVVQCGGESYALPQRALAELVRVPEADAKEAIEHIGGAEVYRLREGLLPLVRLEQILGLAQSARDAGTGRGFYIAVLELEGQRFGLMVDSLEPPEEIVVKPLAAALRGIRLYSGATVLGNGTLAMVLDVAEIAARAGMHAATSLQAAPEMKAEAEERMLEIESSFVVCQATLQGRLTRMAIPLRDVERIVTVELSEVEYAGGRAVLQQENGEVLALQDEDGLLGETPGDELAVRHGTITALVMATQGEPPQYRTGMIVQRVLDVCAGEQLPSDAQLFLGPVARLGERMMTVRRQMAGPIITSASGGLA